MFGECHAHLFMNGINYRRAVEDHKYGADIGIIRRYLQAYREAGVTFIRDGGDRYGVSEQAKKLAGEYGIDYRTPVFAIHWQGHYGGIVGKSVSSFTEYRECIKEVRAHGGDFVKIMVSGIMEYSGYGVLSELALEKERICEMIHIAHEEGFPVMVHANGTEAVLPAVIAGAESIEHGNYISRECMEAMADMGCVWVPTAVTTKNLIGCGRYTDEILKQIFTMECENIAYAYACGVQMAAGSDAGAYMVPHGTGVLQEAEIFQNILGKNGADECLKKGEDCIKTRFKKGPGNGKYLQ